MSNHSKNPRRKRATHNPDHSRQTHVPAPADSEIEARLSEVVKPAIYAEMAHYQRLGLRNRILTLPVMVSLVLTLIWRRIPGVMELVRLLARERVLWTAPQKVSQPALSERLMTFPAELFQNVFERVIDVLPAKQQARNRPQPALFRRLSSHFTGFYALDGSTLEALFRKLKALQEQADAPLAGHIVAAVDLLTHLPAAVWWADDPSSNDKALLPQVKQWLKASTLMVFDLGYFAFTWFDDLTQSQVSFVTRLRAKTSYQVKLCLRLHPQLRDQIVLLGSYRSNPSQYPVRLIEVFIDGEWRSYITNVLDPEQLSIVDVVQLYEHRWHIEGAFLLVKRLLDLAYLHVTTINGVKLQLWATWLFYAVLIDLCDDVAEALHKPLDRISVEMVYRGLYHYTTAVANGFVGDVPSYYLQHGDDLGLVKRLRPSARPSPLLQIATFLD